MKKVLMLGPDLTAKGGITTIVQFYLSGWSGKKYEVFHLPTFIDGSNLVKVFFFFRAIFQYIRFLFVWKPDIVHIHFSWKGSFYRASVFVLLAQLFSTKVILHCNGSRFDVFYKEGKLIRQRWIRWILNQSEGLIVVSRQWRDFFDELGLSIPLFVVYNPVLVPRDISQKKEGTSNVVFLGRLGPRKGVYDLLEAIPQVLETCPNVHFQLGGDGEVDKVALLIKGSQLEKPVELLGWVSGEKKEEVLSQATIFILPTYHEGLPLAILEAMSYGIPVISTPVGGIPEAIVDGETGILVNPGDVDAIARQLVHLLTHSDDREKLGLNGRQKVLDSFAIDRVIEKLFVVYDSILSK